MLLIIGPLILLMTVFGFLFGIFYSNAPQMPKYNSSGNAMLYHDAMNSYATGSLMTVSTPYIISDTPPYFNNITYTAMGDYQSQILTDANTNIRYLVTSFNIVNTSTSFAVKTIKTIAGELQEPVSGFNQNYQVKIILINNSCNATILNAGLNVATNSNVIDSNVYAPIFNRICLTATTPIKSNVIMEPLQ